MSRVARRVRGRAAQSCAGTERGLLRRHGLPAAGDAVGDAAAVVADGGLPGRHDRDAVVLERPLSLSSGVVLARCSASVNVSGIGSRSNSSRRTSHTRSTSATGSSARITLLVAAGEVRDLIVVDGDRQDHTAEGAGRGGLVPQEVTSPRHRHSLHAIPRGFPAISSRISAPMTVNRSLSTIQLSRDRLSLAMMSLGTVQGEDRHE